ncbi:MAG: hypothetical protein LAO08_06520 [Acidobacteriia bacterium]|jgi:hypothetical protein|nr:hypothetical protein [Terriglobia bacterium]
MRSFTVVLNDKESGNFAFEEGFSVAAVDIVDAAIKANDVCMAIAQAVRASIKEYPGVDPDYIKVDSICDQGVLLGSDAEASPSAWIIEYVDDILKRMKADHDD